MARQPVQVHIFLYRKRDGQYEYAIFRRSDLTVCWQGVCGGGEDDETIEEAARRELFEESGVGGNVPLYRMDTVSPLQDRIFDEEDRKNWGKEVVIIPMYYFSVPYDGPIVLSEEHLEVQWLPFEEAYEKLYFQEQKTALYELHEKLRRGLMQ